MRQRLSRLWVDPRQRLVTPRSWNKRYTTRGNGLACRKGVLDFTRRTSALRSRQIARAREGSEHLKSCLNALIKQLVGHCSHPETDQYRYLTLSHRCLVRGRHAAFHSDPQIPYFQLGRRHRSLDGNRRDLRQSSYGALCPPAQ